MIILSFWLTFSVAYIGLEVVMSLDQCVFELSWYGFSFEGSRDASILVWNKLEPMCSCAEVR
jgi:hypothetical protein